MLPAVVNNQEGGQDEARSVKDEAGIVTITKLCSI